MTGTLPFKSVLTVIVDPAESPRLVAAAAQAARASDGHLDLLCLGIDRDQSGYTLLGAAPMVMQVSLDRAEEEARAAAAAAQAALQAEAVGLRATVETLVTQSGVLGTLMARRARFADLVVLPRRPAGSAGFEAETLLEAALFDAAAPVLVLPPDLHGRSPLEAERIVIGWDESTAALNAIRRALPVLKRAARVSIAVIDPPAHGPERSDPGGMLCQMLVRHGVHAEVAVLARTLPRASDVLVRHAGDLDAGLLVMGAYGHSRLMEAVLGGATRDLLIESDVPLFMAH
jgi:nucleotide-binding universal stress UspA family protein